MLLARLTILTTKGEGLLSVVGLVALLLENKPATISRDETFEGNLLAGI
jgi:hypothetical protein